MLVIAVVSGQLIVYESRGLCHVTQDPPTDLADLTAFPFLEDVHAVAVYGKQFAVAPCFQ